MVLGRRGPKVLEAEVLAAVFVEELKEVVYVSHEQLYALLVQRSVRQHASKFNCKSKIKIYNLLEEYWF